MKNYVSIYNTLEQKDSNRVSDIVTQFEDVEYYEYISEEDFEINFCDYIESIGIDSDKFTFKYYN